MKKYCSLLFFTLLFSTLQAQISDTMPQFKRVATFGSYGSPSAYLTASDTAGSIYTVGDFTATMDINPAPNETELLQQSLYNSNFVQKLDKNGRFLWAMYTGSSNDHAFSQITGLKTDRVGNVYILGIYSTDIVFAYTDEVVNTAYNPYPISNITFILKLDKNGHRIWEKFLEPDKDYEVAAYGLAVNSEGTEIVLTGSFKGIVDFDPSLENTTKKSNLRFIDDAFIVKLDSAGSFKWVKTYGGENSQELAISPQIDTKGNIYVGGFFSETVDFDPADNTTASLTAHGNYDGYILKLNSKGEYRWAGHIGGQNNDHVTTIALDKQDNGLVIAGNFIGGADLAPEPFFNVFINGNGGQDFFVTKLDSMGTTQWYGSAGGGGDESVNDVVIDTLNNKMWLVGTYQGSNTHLNTEVGGQAVYVNSNGLNDMFILGLNPLNGKYQTLQIFGGTENDEMYSVALGKNGNVHTAGYFSKKVDFSSNQTPQFVTALGSTNGFSLISDKDLNTLNIQPFRTTAHIAANGVVLDNSRNVITWGDFKGAFDADNSPNATTILESGEKGGKFFIQKTTPEGQLLWAITPNGSERNDTRRNLYTKIMDLITDSEENIYAVGELLGSYYFNNPPNQPYFGTDDRGESFLLKLNKNGVVQWVQSFASDVNVNITNIALDEITGIVTAFGTIAFGDYDFDPSPQRTFRLGAAYGNIFYTQLDKDGNFVTAKTLVSSTDRSQCRLDKALVDRDNNFWVAGGCYGQGFDFNPSHNDTVTLKKSDMFLAKYNNKGEYQTLKFYNNGSGTFNNFKIDKIGNLYITAQYSGKIDVNFSETDSLIFSSKQANNGGSTFLQKINPSGNLIWAKNYPEKEYIDGISAVELDKQGQLYLLGNLKKDITIERLDTAGKSVWERTIGSPHEDWGNGMAADQKGNIWVTGTHTGTMDTDPLPNAEVNISTLIPADTFTNNFFVLQWFNSIVTAVVERPLNNLPLSVFPNPTANGFLTLQATDRPTSGIYQIQVLDLEGKNRLTLQKEWQGKELNLDLSALGTGLYFIHLQNNEGDKGVIKVLKE